MARLSAHGRELLRIELEKDVTDPEDSVSWVRLTRVVMSDGKVMQKQDVRWRRYSYGWKLHATVKKDVTTPEAYAAKVKANLEAKPDARWKVVSGGVPVIVISQAKIMNAIESGDSVGFCKECGAETDGVEPDARNYKCDHCGAMAVYGAEEMLVSG